jgi:hypothetical protein
MLKEIAITPDVFLDSSYSSTGLSQHFMQFLKEPLLQELLVRNLHNGDWYKFLITHIGNWSPKAKELITKIIRQNRLKLFPTQNEQLPDSDVSWCHEAVASSGVEALEGILTTSATKAVFQEDVIVSEIEKLFTSLWWTNRESTIEVSRTYDDYENRLLNILCQANSLLFIDPHINPAMKRYRGFSRLLDKCKAVNGKCRIEIHRVVYHGSGPHRELLSLSDWKTNFEFLKSNNTDKKLVVDVFIWNDFHDRYLLSDLTGILMPNGFDESPDKTRWSRMDRKAIDNTWREFDTNEGHAVDNKHKLQGHFKIVF